MPIGRLSAGAAIPADTEQLKGRIGKYCLYFNKLADLDASVLEQLVAGSVAEIRWRYE